jgi:hypothetical protein
LHKPNQTKPFNLRRKKKEKRHAYILSYPYVYVSNYIYVCTSALALDGVAAQSTRSLRSLLICMFSLSREFSLFDFSGGLNWIKLTWTCAHVGRHIFPLRLDIKYHVRFLFNDQVSIVVTGNQRQTRNMDKDMCLERGEKNKR